MYRYSNFDIYINKEKIEVVQDIEDLMTFENGEKFKFKDSVFKVCVIKVTSKNLNKKYIIVRIFLKKESKLKNGEKLVSGKGVVDYIFDFENVYSYYLNRGSKESNKLNRVYSYVRNVIDEYLKVKNI